MIYHASWCEVGFSCVTIGFVDDLLNGLVLTFDSCKTDDRSSHWCLKIEVKYQHRRQNGWY